MGHFDVQGHRHQVTDTPGLLPRSPSRERNSMERLTVATLEHLPTAVLFVLDLTRESGTAVSDQLVVRAELRERFRGKPWVDVFSKADLIGIGDALGGEGLDEGAGAARAAVRGAAAGSRAREVITPHHRQRPPKLLRSAPREGIAEDGELATNGEQQQKKNYLRHHEGTATAPRGKLSIPLPHPLRVSVAPRWQEHLPGPGARPAVARRWRLGALLPEDSRKPLRPV